MPGPIDAQQIADMAGMGSGGFIGGRNSSDPRAMYEQWQKLLSELEAMRSSGPGELVAPQYRIKGAAGAGNGDGMLRPGQTGSGGEREYLIDGKWASQNAYDDPQFQAMVVDPWIEKEKLRRQEEYQKQIAEMQQRASMAEYDYNDYQRRQEEIKKGAGGAGTLGSTASSPRPGGGGMGSTTRRY